jgi:hypothetical protein
LHIHPFFQLNVEVSLHHMDAVVARGLAKPVAGLLEIADRMKCRIQRKDAKTQRRKVFLTRIARIDANALTGLR